MPKGAPIPAQIADKLRGREFPTFDSFCSEFWRAVSNDEMLSVQFTKLRQMDMKQGLAPVVPLQEQVGERIKYETHHITPFWEGGGVYDMDNLNILTSKLHSQTHAKKSTILTLKSKLEEHTEDEYLTLIERLFKGYYSSEKEHDEIVEHIVSTSEHPDRTGILYDPGQNIEDSPTGVINAIKQWRLENGKTGFKV